MAEYTYNYPHPAVATDCVVFGFDGRDLKVLLIERGLDPFKGMWAFPGGFMRMDETAEQCAIRELREETGLILSNVRQLGAFSGVNRDPRERIVSIAFYAMARQSEVRGGDDAAYARWWSIDDVPQLAFDHDYILRQAMRRIRQDIHFEPIGFGLLEDTFTIADLQRLYECILGVHFDRRNFHRKMLQTGILTEVDEEDSLREKAERIIRINKLLVGSNSESADIPQYYGSHREMRMKSINSLFGDVDEGADINPIPLMEPSETADSSPISAKETVCSHEDNFTPQRSVGRKGKLFRFDKESYDRLKENGNFRLEF